MNSFFLLLTFSLLVLTQIQTGVLGDEGTSAGTTASSSTGISAASKTSAAPKTTATPKTNKKGEASGTPAVRNVDGGSGFLFFLTNTLIHLLYLS